MALSQLSAPCLARVGTSWRDLLVEIAATAAHDCYCVLDICTSLYREFCGATVQYEAASSCDQMSARRVRWIVSGVTRCNALIMQETSVAWPSISSSRKHQ